MFRVDPRKRWNATNFHVERGKRYLIVSEVIAGEAYTDKGTPCTPDGPSSIMGRAFDKIARDARSPLNVVGWTRRDKVKRLRVLVDRFGRTAHFLTIIGCVGEVEEESLEQHAFVIGSSCEIIMPESGELFVFSNDWPGDETLPDKDQPYLNNTGWIQISVDEL